jgi:hypothetical protein
LLTESVMGAEQRNGGYSSPDNGNHGHGGNGIPDKPSQRPTEVYHIGRRTMRRPHANGKQTRRGR